MMDRKLNRAGAALAALLVISVAQPAWSSSGGGLPWEAPLQQIQQSITGPVAGFIALSAVAVAGGILIFGGELNDFARRQPALFLGASLALGFVIARLGRAAIESAGQQGYADGEYVPITPETPDVTPGL